MTNIAFARHRIHLQMRGAGGLASDVIVHWIETQGGALDETTGALVGGVETPVSGVLRALSSEQPARSVVRQFAEIQAGDLLLDLAPDPGVEVLPNPVLSGTVRLDDLAKKGVRFERGGQFYVQKEVGEELARAWTVIVGNQEMMGTVLLRRAT